MRLNYTLRIKYMYSVLNNQKNVFTQIPAPSPSPSPTPNPLFSVDPNEEVESKSIFKMVNHRGEFNGKSKLVII